MEKKMLFTFLSDLENEFNYNLFCSQLNSTE